MQKYMDRCGLPIHWLFVILWMTTGCTPIAGGPPPTRMPAGKRYDAGLAHTTAVQMPSTEYGSQIFLEEAVWIRKSVGEKSELHFTTGIFWGGGFSYYGVIGYRRYLALTESRNIALEARIGGPFYVEIGVPIQQQIGAKNLWLTAHPSIGLNAFGFIHMPLGLSWSPNDRVQLNASMGSRFGGENPMLLHLHGGVSFPF